MVTMPDGTSHYYEYAVEKANGGRVGPYGKHDAERLAQEIGGTVLFCQITRSPWRTA